MKEIAQQQGGRLYYGNDFLAMQQLTLQLTEQFYAQFGNFVLYGCEVSENGISPGVVMLNGKACTFADAKGVTMPYYVKQVKETEDVFYKVGTGIGFENYIAEPCAAGDVGAFRLDIAKRFKDVIQPTGRGYVIYPGDSKKYPVKKFGSTWWTTNNHSSIVYADGAPIDNWTDGNTAQVKVNDGNYPAEYGNWYNWYVTQQANLCPLGWRVPSPKDFFALDIALGGTGISRRDDVIFAKYMDASIWAGQCSGRVENLGALYQGVYAYYLSQSESENSENSATMCSLLILGNRYKEIDLNGINDKKHGLSLRFIITDESLIYNE